MHAIQQAKRLARLVELAARNILRSRVALAAESAELATTSGVVFVGRGLTLGDSDGS